MNIDREVLDAHAQFGGEILPMQIAYIINSSAPEGKVVSLAFDAMRLCLGQKPLNYTTEDVMVWLRLSASSRGYDIGDAA